MIYLSYAEPIIMQRVRDVLQKHGYDVRDDDTLREPDPEDVDCLVVILTPGADLLPQMTYADSMDIRIFPVVVGGQLPASFKNLKRYDLDQNLERLTDDIRHYIAAKNTPIAKAATEARRQKRIEATQPARPNIETSQLDEPTEPARGEAASSKVYSRLEVVFRLAETGNEAAIPLLKTFTTSKDPEMRKAAQNAIDSIQARMG